MSQVTLDSHTISIYGNALIIDGYRVDVKLKGNNNAFASCSSHGQKAKIGRNKFVLANNGIKINGKNFTFDEIKGGEMVDPTASKNSAIADSMSQNIRIRAGKAKSKGGVANSGIIYGDVNIGSHKAKSNEGVANSGVINGNINIGSHSERFLDDILQALHEQKENEKSSQRENGQPKLKK